MSIDAPFALCVHVLGLNSPRLVLRPMSPTDAADLAPLLAAIDPWVRYPYPAAALAASLSASETSAPRFAIGHDGELAGAIALRLNWLRGPFVQLLGLLPDHQRRGIGVAVMHWIEREARRMSERNLWVTASDFNTAALDFYGRVGFERVTTLTDLVRTGRDEILLRKRLD